MEGLLGILGVVLGFAIGSGYSFWAVRRAELADAVFATAALGEELRALARTRGDDEAIRARLQGAWRDNRRALVAYLPPRGFEKFADAFSAEAGGPADSQGTSEELAHLVEQLNTLFWEAHEERVFTLLIQHITSNTLSKQVRIVLD